MATEARLRWNEDEWMAVIGETLPMIASGVHKVDALWKAQRNALHKSRHRDRVGLTKLCTPSNGGFEAAVARFKALPSAERAALSPAPPPPAPPAAPKPATRGAPAGAEMVRWTSRERAVMAAGVALLKQEPGHGELPLYDLYIKAQDMVLPTDRRRNPKSIKQSHYADRGLLLRQHNEALDNGWQFPDTKNPFGLPTSSEVVIAPAPAPPSEDLPKLGASAMNEAVILFGNTMMAALEKLLMTRDAQMAQQVTQTVAEQAARISAEQTAVLSERIGRSVQELLQVQVGHIAAEVSKGLRAVLIEELGGGPSTAPAAPSAAPQASTPPPPASSAATGRAGLRVDVIGTMAPEWMQRIRDAAGEGDEIRFVDFGSARDFAPHRGRHLIVMAQGRMPRVLQKKCEAAGVTPISVRDAAGHVLRAVEDLKASAAAKAVTLQ